jgi:Nucleotidyltransferase domain.
MTRKIANDGNPIDISERMDDLRELFASDPRIVAVYIYGSYGTPDQTPLSDVDLAVLFRRESVPPLEDELRLTASVIDTVGVEDVSVCVLNRLPIVSQFKIVAEGRLIFLSDAEAHLGFVEYVFKVYGDYEPRYRRFIEEYDQALVEAYVHELQEERGPGQDSREAPTDAR